MVFAVEEINRNSSLLPGVKLGYRILDSCDNVHTSLRALLSLLSHSKPLLRKTETQTQGVDEGERVPSCIADSPVPAVIGLASSSPTRAVAHTLGPFRIPLVRHELRGYTCF